MNMKNSKNNTIGDDHILAGCPFCLEKVKVSVEVFRHSDEHQTCFCINCGKPFYCQGLMFTDTNINRLRQTVQKILYLVNKLNEVR